MSLSDYLVAEIRRVAERPSIAELRERLERRARVNSPVSAADAVRDAAQLLLDRLTGGIRHGTIRIVGFDLIIGQGIDQIFLTHILEEVFLSPTLEHAIGQNDGTQVPTTGDDGRLVPALGQASDLAEAKFSFEEAHGLLVEKVVHAPSVQLGFVLGEAGDQLRLPQPRDAGVASELNGFGSESR